MLINKILKARAKTEDTSPEIKTSSGILKLLCGTAINNSNNKNPSANRYDKSLKLFCSSLFLLCGRLVYQTIRKNLPNSIPSISIIQRSLRSNDRILEGEIRLPQLKDFLLKRGYPLKVWISEDQTRIVSSREYDSVNNRIVGFTTPYDENGCPLKNSFIATSATEIQKYFKNETVANNLYAIVAQSLAPNSPSFTLCVFGSNNKFTHDVILKRWNYIENEAKKLDIVVEGFSSDGDSRILKAMKMKSVMPCAKDDKLFECFQANYECNRTITIHISTKLRNRLLSPSIILPMEECCYWECLVRFFKTHYKHGAELQYIRIPKQERINAAHKLSAGVTVTRVLDDNRRDIDSRILSRKDILTRKDINNIKQCFKIDVVNGIKKSKESVVGDTDKLETRGRKCKLSNLQKRNIIKQVEEEDPPTQKTLAFKNNDSVPAHRAKETLLFLREQNVSFIELEQWLPSSPDCTPCDYFL
ncbi:hypothetical protein ILUMI_09059 [Ignelater luminosus]|uniref:Uncharacterized protein n=1 Tax=Ignelater luminosus TaxID=2038154 RepID=A0A8K0D0H5_IGNLU|nr:hypothetical protein ILUMI_09059 [Ignelater luminosus]